MIGYKGFEKDLTCRDFQYEIGKTFTFDGKIELCESGFHFCKTLGEVLHYYDFDNGNRFCEVEILGKVIEGEDKCVTDKIKIIREIQITVDVLSKLAQDKDEDVRIEVAMNPNTPIEILSNLAQDEDWRVRELVAENLNTPIDILKQLAKDEVYYVRYEAESNPNYKD